MKGLLPFFCYYGGKWRAAKRYPEPNRKQIVEPFAGAAGYSLRYPHLDVSLYEVDDAVFGVWHYLINVSPAEIMQLPDNVDNVDEINATPEAKWLIAFWLNKGSATPKRTASSWSKSGDTLTWGAVVKQRIAAQVPLIRHWKIFIRSYQDAPNIEATWFIDPPYSGACGRHYRCKIESYESLSQWCRERLGQVIVCERHGANWLPFKTFTTFQAVYKQGRLASSIEVMWQNEPSSSNVTDDTSHAAS